MALVRWTHKEMIFHRDGLVGANFLRTEHALHIENYAKKKIQQEWSKDKSARR
jgi:hypothetical protein